MMFLANVMEMLAFLFASVALVVATIAVRTVHRRTQPTPAPIVARTRRPTTAADAAPAAQPANGKRNGNGNGHARGSELRDQVRAFLSQHAGQDFSLVQVSNAVGRRTATVSYTLSKLVDAGDVQLTNLKPKRYAITQQDTQAAHQHSTTQPTPAVQPAESAASQPQPAAQATPDPTSTTAEPVESTSTSAPSKPANGTGRGNELRDQVRAFLAEHAGQDFSLVQVSNAVGRRTATVSYALGKLVDAGEVDLTNPKPRRYAITQQGTQATRQHLTAQITERTEPAAQPAAQATTPEPADGGNSNGQARGSELRDQVRAFLAQHAGQHFTLVEIGQALDRPSAALNRPVTKMVDAGEVQATGSRPRRYTLAEAAPTLLSAEPEPATDATAPAGQVPASQGAEPAPRKRRGSSTRTQQAAATVTPLPTERRTSTSTSKPRGKRRS